METDPTNQLLQSFGFNSGTLALIALAIKWLPELISSVMKGGGLFPILKRFFYGENAPKVILEDYKQELNPKKDEAA